MRYLKKNTGVIATAIFLMFFSACGGGNGNGGSNSTPSTSPSDPPAISISPINATIAVGESRTFTVSPQNSSFTFTPPANSGCVANAGSNTIVCTPTAAGTYSITVTASSGARGNATATLTVTPPVSPNTAPKVAPLSELQRKLLIIHATWSDRTGINTPKLNGNQIYDIVFNPATRSVNDYYKELFAATDDIILPAQVNNPLDGRAGIIEVTLSGRHTNPGRNHDPHAELMKRVLVEASGQGLIDFSVFDTNRNGTLEVTELSIGVIVDGYESGIGAPTPNFWGMSHDTCNMTPAGSLTNNVEILKAFGVGSLHRTTGNTASDMLTIGIISHEFGHSAYDFIDTYETNNSTNASGHGFWSLMGDGSNSRKTGEYLGASPGYVDAYNLVRSGIVIPGVISASENDITINSHLDIYRVKSTASDTQYFLLQQRSYGSADNYDRGTFYSIDSSSNSAAGGLLIYHIDQNVPISVIHDSGGIHNKNTHYGAGIVEAHGGRQHLRQVAGNNSNHGDLKDLWGGSNSLFSDTSDPSSRLYSKYTNDTTPPFKDILSGVEIWNIAWNNGAKNTTFNVEITDVPVPGTISATILATFGSQERPYTPVEQTVTVINTGTGAVTLTQPTARNYDISQLSATDLAPMETATFTVSPKANLSAGTYNETITINGTGYSRATVNARFSVVTTTEHTSVNNFAGLRNAINGYSAATGNTVITVTADFRITSGLTIPANSRSATLTIRSANPQNPAILTRGFTDVRNNAGLFTINSGAKLILEDIIIDGNKTAYPDNISSLVYVSGDGEFMMKNGAILRNNRSYDHHIGGGVTVYGGRFVMNGGEISGNTGYNCSGVFFLISGEFVMTGGEISDNISGSGVWIDPDVFFTMTGGKIIGNTAPDRAGGGVFVRGGEFIMTGGEITGNTAHGGGGVSVSMNGEFIITGGEITGNTPDNVNYI